MSYERMRVAVIGAGSWTQICHIPCLQADPRVEVVALCGRTAERVEAQARQFGIPRTVTQYEEIFAMDDIDAVTISTPNVSHAPIALGALAAGKHVFCEKPLAMNQQESASMVRAAETSGKVHHVSFTFRHLFGTRRAREMLASGEIGDVFHARFWTEGGGNPNRPARWRDRRDLAGSGILGDMGSHLIDLAHWLSGPITSLGAQVHSVVDQRPDDDGNFVTTDADDVALFTTRFQSGAAGLFFLSWNSVGRRNSYIEFQGTEGSLVCHYSRGEVDRLQIVRPGTELQDVDLDGEPEPNHAMYRMFRTFVDAVHGQVTDAPTFVDGHRAQVVIDSVLDSSAQGQQVPVAYM